MQSVCIVVVALGPVSGLQRQFFSSSEYAGSVGNNSFSASYPSVPLLAK